MPVDIAGYWTNESLAQVAQSPLQDYATIIVNGQSYRMWKTVRVKFEHGMAWQEAQFSVAEPVDVKAYWTQWQINVGMTCQVLLGGVPVINGLIEIREAAYDAENHGLMLYVRSFPANGSDSSVHFPAGQDDTGTQLHNATYTQIMERALEGFGIGIVAPADKGDKFPNFQINFGETPWQVQDRTVRFLPSGARTSDDGLAPTWRTVTADDLNPTPQAEFVEGRNILAAHALIDITGRYGFIDVRSHRTNYDQVSPAEGAEVRGYAQDSSVPQNRLQNIWAEENATQSLDFARAAFNMGIQKQEVIKADITVYGWFKAPGAVFRMLDAYYVYSPMLALDRVLYARVVVFTQGPEGTLTQLELCTPESFGAGYTRADIPSNSAPTDQGQYWGQGVSEDQALAGAEMDQSNANNPNAGAVPKSDTPAPLSPVQQSQQVPFEPTNQQMQDITAGIPSS
jgi:prophage tail gpP-like protein